MSGGLQAHWKSGNNDGSGASCEIAPTGDAAFFGVFGMIGSELRGPERVLRQFVGQLGG
jgi:hypothetical protein